MISVIIPVYNAAQYLNKCIESVVNQTCRDIEILLIDDGSTDDSSSICDEWERRDSRIKVVHKANGGLVSSWKRGIEEATGEYVSFIDSDDWVDVNMFEELFRETSGSSAEIIASDYIIERPNGQEYVYQTLKPGVYDKEGLTNNVVPFIMGCERRPVTISRCMKLISKKLITDNMQYADPKVRMAEDSTIMVPVLMDCTRLVVMDHRAYYHYYYTPDSMVHKYDKTMYPNLLMVYGICGRVIEDKAAATKNPSYYKSLKEALDREMVLWLLLCVKNEARGNKEHAAANIKTFNLEQRELIKKAPVKVKEKSNILVYAALKHPNALVLGLLNLALKIYYA